MKERVIPYARNGHLSWGEVRLKWTVRDKSTRKISIIEPRQNGRENQEGKTEKKPACEKKRAITTSERRGRVRSVFNRWRKGKGGTTVRGKDLRGGRDAASGGSNPGIRHAETKEKRKKRVRIPPLPVGYAEKRKGGAARDFQRERGD